MGRVAGNISSGLSKEFIERLTAIVGPSLSLEIKKTFVERPTTFRVNTIKTSKHLNIKTYLEEKGFKIKQVSWYKNAFVLLNKSKRELMETDVYKDGRIYLQSLASMVPPLVLEPKPGEKILDLTAAPGSKTSQIAAMMERTGELVANDMDKVRFFKLQHNMELLGVSSPHHPLLGKEGRTPPGGDGVVSPTVEHSVERRRNHHSPAVAGSGGDSNVRMDSDMETWKFVLRMEPGWKLCSEFPEGYFDKILLDAPCSAEARFVEGDRQTYGYWSERKIKEMVSNQWRLLLAAWYALKPSGTLVYSTCTFAPEENEYQVSKFMEKVGNAKLEQVDISELKRLPIVTEWKGKPVNPETKKCLRVYPTKEIEGFFVAKIYKVE